jgi:L-iditol 2-dehydrogenase
MKALVKYKHGEDIDHGMRVEDLPEPQPKQGELKVKIVAAGICGTDLHIMNDKFANCKPPIIMGHEYVGIVEELGADVSGFSKGDYIVSTTGTNTCGHCRYCRAGLLMLCDQRLPLGARTNGVFAEYLTIAADLAFKVPAEIQIKDEMAICEPFACVVRNVVERATVKAGDVVLVSGPGAIGLLTIQLAKLQGAYVIALGTSRSAHRLNLAKQLGADQIATDPQELSDIIAKATNSYGVDVAFECAGVVASSKVCLESLRKQGLYSQVGVFGEEIPIDMNKFLFKEVQITNSYASEPSSWEIALRLLKNKQVTFTPLISERVPLENWEDGFKFASEKRGFKVLLIP